MYPFGVPAVLPLLVPLNGFGVACINASAYLSAFDVGALIIVEAADGSFC